MASKLASRANQLVRLALGQGKLNIPANCELCGFSIVGYRGSCRALVGHHYAGYEGENALKVWWICHPCNAHLIGKHDGSLTQEQARAFIQSKR